MKILKLSVAFLSLLFLPFGQLYAQADNYEKHKNDDVISDLESGDDVLSGIQKSF